MTSQRKWILAWALFGYACLILFKTDNAFIMSVVFHAAYLVTGHFDARATTPSTATTDNQ